MATELDYETLDLHNSTIDALENELPSSRSNVWLFVSLFASTLGIISSTTLTVTVVRSKLPKEKPSYWLLVNFAVCNVLYLLIVSIGYRFVDLNIPFLVAFPVCYVSVPVGATAWFVMYLTLMIYAMIVVHQARLEVRERTEQYGTDCGKRAFLIIIISIWVFCILEVLSIGYGVGSMDVIGNYCLFMHNIPSWASHLCMILNQFLPSVIIFICGMILVYFSCKSEAVRQTSISTIVMCLLLPVTQLPLLIIGMLSTYGNVIHYCYYLSQIAWSAIPMSFLIFGNLRRHCRKACCCCACCSGPEEDDDNELSNLVAK